MATTTVREAVAKIPWQEVNRRAGRDENGHPPDDWHGNRRADLQQLAVERLLKKCPNQKVNGVGGLIRKQVRQVASDENHWGADKKPIPTEVPLTGNETELDICPALPLQERTTAAKEFLPECPTCTKDLPWTTRVCPKEEGGCGIALPKEWAEIRAQWQTVGGKSGRLGRMGGRVSPKAGSDGQWEEGSD